LFCAWLAWSRFRVVLAIRDKTMPSVFAALDVTLRRLGGAPTYVLTDNEKTVTVEHVAGIAVRNPQMVAFARHYGLTVHTREPADPASKGGSESTVKLAKADLVPKDTNLLAEYSTFGELEAACEAFCDLVNTRTHRVTRRAPVEMLAEEQARLHPVPGHPHTVAFGLTRVVPASMPMVAFEGGQYSVPHALLGATVWVRVHGRGKDEQVVIVHVGGSGPVEVARPGEAGAVCPRRRGRGGRVSTKATKTTPPVLGVPSPPDLPTDVEALLRRLRLPHIRRHAPEVVATAKTVGRSSRHLVAQWGR